MELANIGYISKAHGLKGHVVLRSSFDFSKKIKVFFIEANGSQAPHFIEEIKVFKDDYLLKLEGVNSIEAANKLKSCAVLTEKKFVIKENAFEFLQFTLVDTEKGEVGVIEGLMDNPGNPLLQVMRNGKEILLPYNTDFIQKIDSAGKQLVYRSPEGLLDMFI